MPVSLPPAVVPQQITVEAVRSASPLASATLGDVQVRLLGTALPGGFSLDEVVRASKQLSDAVYAIRDVFYLGGYPAARVYYALDGNDLYVWVQPGGVSKLAMPPIYQPYFETLLKHPVLESADLEPARALASLHADRAGDTGQLAFQQDADGQLTLGLDPQRQWSDSASATAGIGNPGNRYIGRYFADFVASAGFESGNEVSMGLRHALTDIDSEDEGNQYREASLGWSKVSPHGIWGINGYYADYRQQAETTRGDQVEVDGGISQVELGWQGFVMADFQRRWSVGSRLIYTNKYLDLSEGSIQLQRQEYVSAEVSTGYATEWALLGMIWKIDSQLAVQFGMGRDRSDDLTVLSDLGYGLANGSFSASTALGEATSMTWNLSGQLSDSTLPEQRQWVLGGQYNIEAYLPGEALGDSGAIARLLIEHRFNRDGAWQLVPGAFVEYAMAHLQTPLTAQYSGTQELSDAGLALKFSWQRHLEARVSYALPLDGRKSDADLLFRLAGTF